MGTRFPRPPPGDDIKPSALTTIYQVARRPGLPAGHTTRDMADDYARWIDGRFQGPVGVFPDPIVRETAERIPQATLRRYEGVGHAVSKTHKRRFEDDVLGFLRG